MASRFTKLSRKRCHTSIEHSDNCNLVNCNAQKNVVPYEPNNWQISLENIREMRKHRNAPVDSMGAEKCADETASKEVTFTR